MYKIFINQVQVFLTGKQWVPDFEQSKKRLKLHYTSTDDLDEIMSYIEGDQKLKEVYIVGEYAAEVWEDFQSLYKIIPAAGGLVFQEKTGEMLLIFRKGRWDLPKGKMEKKETTQESAIREVMEETGIPEPRLGQLIKFNDQVQETVLHTYQLKGKRILKSTWWYEMFLNKSVELIPQAEENIEEVKWVKMEDLESHLDNSFSSVRDVIYSSKYFQQKILPGASPE